MSIAGTADSIRRDIESFYAGECSIIVVAEKKRLVYVTRYCEADEVSTTAR
jgi:hypothetical protein